MKTNKDLSNVLKSGKRILKGQEPERLVSEGKEHSSLMVIFCTIGIILLLFCLLSTKVKADEIDTAAQQIKKENMKGVSVKVIDIPKLSQSDIEKTNKAIEEIKKWEEENAKVK